jgi:hypothetical protein
MKYYQQGDVVLIKVNQVSGKAQDTKVVQEGEHTGHAHRLNSYGKVFKDGDKLFVKAAKGTSIGHEEHSTIVIEEGDYEVRIVRQKDPFTKLVSKVLD